MVGVEAILQTFHYIDCRVSSRSWDTVVGIATGYGLD
jgi:hypothetical protein